MFFFRNCDFKMGIYTYKYIYIYVFVPILICITNIHGVYEQNAKSLTFRNLNGKEHVDCKSKLWG